MPRAITNLLLIPLILSLSVGCRPKAPAQCRRLCSLPEEQQHQSFKSFTVERQFELYMGCQHEQSCWRDSVSPQGDFGRWMAEDNRAASFLTERLAAERDEVVVRDIIRVLRLMAVGGQLKGQRRIAEAVNRAVDGMDSEDDRVVRETQTWAKEIEANTR